MRTCPIAFRPPAPIRVLRWASPPSDDAKLRLTLPRRTVCALRRPRSVNGEGAPLRLLQPTLRHVHLQRPLDSRCDLRLRSCHVPRGEPRRTCRAVSRLTALHALRSIPLTLPPIRRSRAPLISWWAPISASPRRGAPRSVALSSTGGECASTSDTPCHDELRAFRRAARRQDRLPRSLVKGCSSERPEVPSIDECPLGPSPLSGRWTSNASPPPVPGLGRP
jgi:hypothetical protein